MYTHVQKQKMSGCKKINMKRSVSKLQCVSQVAPLLVLCTMLLLEGSMAKHVLLEV